MNREARREFNRDSFDLWCATVGDANATGIPGHPDTYHGRTGKPGSRVNQDDYWLEAISTPDARATDLFFARALDLLRAAHPLTSLVLEAFYVYGDGSPRQDEEYVQVVHDAIEAGITFILDRADYERRLLYWPSPDAAKGYVEKNVTKKRDFTYYYFREIDGGVATSVAVERAARMARCSYRAGWYWLRELDAKGEAS
jgi:hypothetical protein